MAEVTLAGGATGSNIAISGADRVFEVTDGEVMFSTDSGATLVRASAGDKIVFYDGQTVTPVNQRPVSAVFSHMAYG